MMLVTIITVHLVVLFSRVATGQEMVREKNSSRSGKSREILF